ncbi:MULTISPECIES: aminotransferase class V-fold PLP-dependent enzyme [Cyanophyceae]|uniref:aminotransferase class V-fold PLP-dependent enzyme n=1 Tax=Cyanophyceae TaxID=3028117 RepID=UPI00168733C8|nr:MULTISPECIES: aminotransferase class V-fold PLP-dependent enzyme [Cyanophyceae]MBD1916763.1 aminotransferase class V-fold PLP-dependent enzyme [Phormidium sp. FACHB-77]MBD2029393.1 aminotransferase class V-fold PLP-dependent enzyme [Phormidium sp. FACHB-322]MBD2051968.1 aminotransferase class V-fold PLP-dependent enzyme [Leptolyngbya sp. FACHB-60]
MDSSAAAVLDRLALHRQQFPALRDKQYFNYGGQGPMAQATLDAVFQAHHHMQEMGPFSGATNQWVMAEAAQTRAAIAVELGTTADTITLTEDVTVGCNIPLWGIAWNAGDHMLLSDCEHPGVIAAVQEICRRFGVTYSLCPLLETVNGGDPAAVVAEHLQPNTRLLVVSHILWNTGQVLPLERMVEVCRDRPNPVLVLVDAAQSVGALPLDLPALGVDFYAFTGHKWWCGPAGLGGLYVRPEAMAHVEPTFIGWRGITTDAAANPTGWKPNGQRYEVATSNYPLLAGLRRAIAHQAEWGTAAQRYQRLVELSQQLWSQLQELPYLRPVRQTPPDSGLVSFWVLENGEPSPAWHKRLVDELETQGVFLRTLQAPNCVRACTHYLTLESEIDGLVAAIESILSDLT